MSCNLTAGWVVDCKDSQGGINKVYILKEPLVDFTAADGIITALETTTSAVVDGADWFVFEVPKQTSSFTETINASIENGTVFYEQSLTLIFNKMEATKRNQILLMAQNEKLFIAVEDGNGTFWSIGLTRGASLSAGSVTSGVAYGDRNGGELTLTGMEPDPSYTITAAIVNVTA